MFESKDLVTGSSELIKTHKIEFYGEIACTFFTLNEIFSCEEVKIKIFQISLAFFKMKTAHGNMLGYKDLKELTDMKTWEQMKRSLLSPQIN